MACASTGATGRLGRGCGSGGGRPRDWQEPFKVSARLVDADGQVVAATDAEPVSGAYPATAWRPGEVVADAYEIPLPAGLPPGDYVPLVIVYDPATGAERGRVELPPVTCRAARLARRAGRWKSSRHTRPMPALATWSCWLHPAGPHRALWPRRCVAPDAAVAGSGGTGRRAAGELLAGGGGLYPLGEEPVGGDFPAGGWQPARWCASNRSFTCPTSCRRGPTGSRCASPAMGSRSPGGAG